MPPGSGLAPVLTRRKAERPFRHSGRQDPAEQQRVRRPTPLPARRVMALGAGLERVADPARLLQAGGWIIECEMAAKVSELACSWLNRAYGPLANRSGQVLAAEASTADIADIRSIASCCFFSCARRTDCRRIRVGMSVQAPDVGQVGAAPPQGRRETATDLVGRRPRPTRLSGRLAQQHVGPFGVHRFVRVKRMNSRAALMPVGAEGNRRRSASLGGRHDHVGNVVVEPELSVFALDE